jgi:hypothetical protein
VVATPFLDCAGGIEWLVAVRAAALFLVACDWSGNVSASSSKYVVLPERASLGEFTVTAQIEERDGAWEALIILSRQPDRPPIDASELEVILKRRRYGARRSRRSDRDAAGVDRRTGYGDQRPLSFRRRHRRHRRQWTAHSTHGDARDRSGALHPI